MSKYLQAEIVGYKPDTDISQADIYYIEPYEDVLSVYYEKDILHIEPRE